VEYIYYPYRHLRTFFLFHNLKEKITSYTTLTLNKKTSLIFILIFTVIAVVDSTIVKFSAYSGVELQSSLHLAIFVVFSIIFVASSTILLNSVRKIMPGYAYKPTSLGLRYSHGIIIATLILTVAIMLIIIFQMILLNKYSLILLRVQTYVSRVSPLIFISFLIFLFKNWLKSKRNYIIVLYTISFSVVSANLVLSVIYLESYFFQFRSVT
jgi:hypothetical protein